MSTVREYRLGRRSWLAFTYWTLLSVFFLTPATIYGIATTPPVNVTLGSIKVMMPDPQVLWAMCLTLFVLGLAVWTLVRCIKQRVLITAEALIVTNWTGAQTVNLSWNDITSLTDAYPHMPYFFVWTGSQRFKIQSFNDLMGIADEIRRRAPRLAANAGEQPPYPNPPSAG